MRVDARLLPELLHVIYDSTPELDAWMGQINRTFARTVRRSDAVFLLTQYWSGGEVLGQDHAVFCGPRIETVYTKFQQSLGGHYRSMMPRDGFLRFYFPRTMAVTQSECERDTPWDQAIRRARRHGGVADLFGLLLHPKPGLVATLSVPLWKHTSIERHQRTLLSRIGLHLETALRLRLQPESVKAVLDPEGRVLHSALDDRPAAPIRALERARSDAEKHLALWTALVDGRFSLVERDAARGVARHYVLLENTPAGRERRGLTSVEATAVHHSARGLASKLIAYSLGLSPAAVSMALTAASAKLGFRSPLQLSRAVRMLVGEPAQLDTSRLTSAEREVLALLLEGGTNRQIGEKRGTSERTVANQVASILQKTGASSRRALQAAR